MRKEFEDINAVMAKRGERVIGFAEYVLPSHFDAKYPFDAD